MNEPALSHSRISDFESCPLKFQYRTINRVPEPPAPAAVKGTLVHAVLEHLFDLPANDRNIAVAQSLLEPQWGAMLEEEPELNEMFAHISKSEWMDSARSLIKTYFSRENPRGLAPSRANRERRITVELNSGIRFRGVIDRVDVAKNGDTRVVDYKTGKQPPERFRDGALNQLRTYGLLLSYEENRLPVQGQLIYLGSNQTLTYWMDPADNERIEARIANIWDDIRAAITAGVFTPKKSKLCDWCSFTSICPAFGGAPLPLDEEGVDKIMHVELGTQTNQ